MNERMDLMIKLRKQLTNFDWLIMIMASISEEYEDIMMKNHGYSMKNAYFSE